MLHGIRVNEPVTGARSLQLVATAVIGLVATSSAVAAEDQAAIDAAFPLDRPVLVTDIRAAIDAAGAEGTLKPALEAIADQVTPVLVIVRVAEGEGDDPEEIAADQDLKVIGDIVDGQGTGIQALLAAESEVGVRPRILGVPGLDSQAVVNELVIAAQHLRGFVYAAATGADTAAAILYRAEFSARELMLIWPDFSTGGIFPGDAVARAMGLRARIDEQVGWHKTLSNVAVNGVTGLTRDIAFDLQDESTTVGALNTKAITTMVRLNGHRFWGNRTCSEDAIWAFESRVRTAQALQDTIAGGLAWAIDKPLTPQLARDVVETINAEFRLLKAQGRIIGGEVLPIDTDLNTAAHLASGRLALDYEFTDTAPLEGLTLNQRVTDRFYASFAEQLQRL
jgi:phage tail sheath protein FI